MKSSWKLCRLLFQRTVVYFTAASHKTTGKVWSCSWNCEFCHCISKFYSGSWRTKQFKKYNFEAFGIMPSGGHLHPLMKVRNEFRQIFFQMGFSEMPTNRSIFLLFALHNLFSFQKVLLLERAIWFYFENKGESLLGWEMRFILLFFFSFLVQVWQVWFQVCWKFILELRCPFSTSTTPC